ncbi:hypothetical protein VTJ49DRAFT_2077 [Mycothermus thermophilus]|uniref:Smr domain-containing protein n=1 Tax=Humicola insolens TaxID=85995 RepID=A0ABR3VAQ6_HUMIN
MQGKSRRRPNADAAGRAAGASGTSGASDASDVAAAEPDTNASDENMKKLIDEFRSTLEEPVVISIAMDFDLVKDFDQVRQMLSQLAETAPAEAATGFDASGLGSSTEIDGARRDDTGTSPDGLDSWVENENSTTFSEYSDMAENRCLTSLADLTDDQKIQELRVVFQDRWRDTTLQLVLRRCNGSLEDALDELLNRQYLEETGQFQKGVDGFAVEDDEEVGLSRGKSRSIRKTKAPKKKMIPIAYKSVSSSGDDDGELQSAKDFAGATTTTKTSRQARPLPTPGPLLTHPRPITTTSPLLSATTTTPLSPTSPTGSSTTHLLSTAASLRRMGPLGRQAAVVYTERARSERALLAAQASRDAEALVERQSSATHIDLHGVFVMDGVRITRRKLWGWWNGLDGENRKVLARQEGFTVVTGIGRHSEGGVSRMRQAVGAYLRNDGWRFEVLTGRFLVTGRA